MIVVACRACKGRGRRGFLRKVECAECGGTGNLIRSRRRALFDGKGCAPPPPGQRPPPPPAPPQDVVSLEAARSGMLAALASALHPEIDGWLRLHRFAARRAFWRLLQEIVSAETPRPRDGSALLAYPELLEHATLGQARRAMARAEELAGTFAHIAAEQRKAFAAEAREGP